MAQRNTKLEKALNDADLAIPDGIGLRKLAKFLALDLPEEKILRFIVGFFQGLRVGAATFLDRNWLTDLINPIKGRVLFLDLIEFADKKHWKVFFLGGLGDEAGVARVNDKLKIGKLQI